jgi:hypothetical protein
MRVCVFVETFGIFIYICAGLKMQCNLIPHLSYCRPLAAIFVVRTSYEAFRLENNEDKIYI